MFSLHKVLFTLSVSNLMAITVGQPITTKASEDTLVLLHVLFRHGDRTSQDISHLYKTNPYKNYTFYPYGRGELTNAGKRTEYNIGKALRNKYGDFLGITYTPDILYAQSTAYNRTKASLQLVLASLFPPRNNQIWNILMYNWQPIPYSYSPRNNDPVLFPLQSSEFIKRYNEYLTTPEYQQLQSKYQDLFDYVSENVGSTIDDFVELYHIYDNLKTDAENGLAIPEWAKPIYPFTLEEASTHAYQVLTATRDLKQAITGCLLTKIASDTLDKITGNKYLENTKLFLYSAHDVNIATFLIALGVYDYSDEIPPYGSYVVVEIHKFDEDYGIQVYFENYTGEKPLLLKLPNCSNPCPLEDFFELTEEYYSDEPEQCNSSM